MAPAANPLQDLRIACVHEWLTDWGGSEDVTRLMLECCPQADLYATIDFLSDGARARLDNRPIRTTFLQRAPFARRSFWNYLPLMPLAVERHDLSGYDAIVSSSHAFAKGVLTTAEQLHVSYVHSPMRYLWDLHHQYMRDYKLQGGPKGWLASWLFHKLRLWDRQTAGNVDLFLANSKHVQRRIWRTYRRPARVLYPPVRTGQFALQERKEDFYLTVSRLVSYKRIDLMLEAFRRMPARQLVVIGDGPEAAALRATCPPNVRLLGYQSDEVVRQHMGAARAFVFAAHEDFGISPVEAQACGTPVIAYGVGGAAETVRDWRGPAPATGVLFPQQTPESLVEAVERFEQAGPVFDPQACRQWAEGFSEARFRAEFADILQQAWERWRQDPAGVEPLLAGSAVSGQFRIPGDGAA